MKFDMAETKSLDPTKAGELAQSIVKLFADVDSETRRRALDAALTLLGENTIAPSERSVDPRLGDANVNQNAAAGKFFNRGEKLRPAENAVLCAAYHFSKFGLVPFSLDDLRTIGSNAGLILPNRLDMTLQQAAKGGKKLFQSVGRGQFKPTTAAGVPLW
jgi:hypothetical protein